MSERNLLGLLVAVLVAGIIAGVFAGRELWEARKAAMKLHPTNQAMWQSIAPGTFVQFDKKQGVICLAKGETLEAAIAEETYKCERTK